MASKKKKQKSDGMISTAAAAALLGLSTSQFRSVCEKLGREPDGTYTNPNYRSGPPALLWLRRKVVAMKRLKIVRDAVARKGGHAPKDYRAILAAKYGSPRAALPDACEAMFNLNRYTRHSTCSAEHRTEILRLKSELIAHLYEQEVFTDRVERLVRTLPAKTCYGCDGLGCDRCDDTGVFAEAREVSTYLFSFTVDGQRFTWMSPDFALNFTPTVEATRKDDGAPRQLDTALNISRGKLPEAKALVRFALEAPKARKQRRRTGRTAPVVDLSAERDKRKGRR